MTSTTKTNTREISSTMKNDFKVKDMNLAEWARK